MRIALPVAVTCAHVRVFAAARVAMFALPAARVAMFALPAASPEYSLTCAHVRTSLVCFDFLGRGILDLLQLQKLEPLQDEADHD